MATTHHGGDSAQRGFGDTIWARLIALAIAVGLSWAFWITWSDDVIALIEGGPDELPLTAQPMPDDGIVNEALQACLDKRIGDVQQMAADGIISEAQQLAFTQRASDLCRAQNPG